MVFLFSIGRVRSYTLGLRGGCIIHNHSVLNADMLLRKMVFRIFNIVSVVLLLSALLDFKTPGLKVWTKWGHS